MSVFRLEIDMDGLGADDLVRVLRTLAMSVQMAATRYSGQKVGDGGRVRDESGRVIGDWRIDESG